MIGNNISPHHGRRFHMDAAGPSLAAITRVHLKNKDIQSAIGRKFNGNPNDTTTFITALDTLLDRTDIGPYARGRPVGLQAASEWGCMPDPPKLI